MAAEITIKGSVDDVISATRLLELGRQAAAQGVNPELLRTLRTHGVLEAIRLHRQQTGCGLAEAKQYVESLPEALAAIQKAVRA